jgi:hypothetical protein
VVAALAALALTLSLTALLPSARPASGTTTTTTNPNSGPKTPPSAYWLVATDGGVFSFGGAGFYGSTGNIVLNKPIVGMSRTVDSLGYWLVASDGGIFSFGDATFYGSTGSLKLNKPIVGMATTPDGKGYWLVATDGGIFAFGDAAFYGSTGSLKLNKPIVGMATTPDGGGYWLVASDGGIFSFGDAKFFGSTGNIVLNKPIVGMAATADGGGYWFSASDGGIFSFGDAKYDGGLGGLPLKRPVVAMTATADGGGYWLTDDNGAVSPFGDAEYWGSAPQTLNKPIVGMSEAIGNNTATGGSYPSGAFGYDVSNYQCNEPLPNDQIIRAVEVEGESFGAVNKCLAAQATWAGGGLNLYVYLTYGNTLPPNVTTAPPAACNGDTSCAYGFAVAQDAFTKATTADIPTGVTWWLDVEPDPSWSSNTTENAQMVAGALLGLKAEGLNNAGIYTSPLTWHALMGDNYQPAVPIWLAWYTGSPQTNCANGISYAASHGDYLPSGPIVMTQYGDSYVYQGNDFDQDYAC